MLDLENSLSAHTNRALVAHGKAAISPVGDDDIVVVSVARVARVGGHDDGAGDGAALEGVDCAAGEGVEGCEGLCGGGGDGQPGEEGGEGDDGVGELHFGGVGVWMSWW